MDTNESLLKAILATVARQNFPTADLAKIVSPTAGGGKQIKAYNLCDGRTPQSQIAKQTKIDRSNLSKSISRWTEAGVLFRVGEDLHPLHLYPIPKEYWTNGSKRKAKKNE